MSTGVQRRFLRISEPVWRVLLVGAVVALWFLVVLTGTARADDCLEYIKTVKNFVAIPRGLLEDCMRTGVAQAVLTGTIAGVGGAAIAAAVAKAIKGTQQGKEVPGPDVPGYRDGREGPPKDNPFDPTTAQRRKKWEDEKLVWDPQDLGWRKPRPDEYPPPERPPETPPPYTRQSPRGQTPVECLFDYDSYVRAQARLLALEPRMDQLSADYRLAQDWLQAKLGIFTAQFAVDMTDFFQLGSGAIRAAQPISQAIGRMGSIRGMAQAAARKAAALAKSAAELLKELAELGAKAAKLRTAAGVLTEAAKVLGRHADELAEAVLALDKRVAANRQLLTVASELEARVTNRGAVVARLMDAEKRLKTAEMFWERKQQLQRWAEGERASITAQQARLALDAQAELDAVNGELRGLSATIAQSPEVTQAAGRTGKATTTVHAIEARIRELESEAQALSARLETIRKLSEKKQAFLKAEEAMYSASEALDAIDAKISGLKGELDELGKSPALPGLKEKESAAFRALEQADSAATYETAYYLEAQKANARTVEQAEAARVVRGEEAPFTPEELARMEGARLAEARARGHMTEAKNLKAIRETDLKNARYALDQEMEHTRGLNAPEVERVKGELDGLQRSRVKAEATKNQAVSDHDAAGQAMQPYSHPGVDPNAGPAVEAELQRVREELLPSKRSELGPARNEFNEAYNSEAQVKAQLEAQRRPALDARRADAEAKLKRANRSWQEVAAEENPGEFQPWKLEVEGTDPFSEAPNELRPMQQEVLDARKEEAALEKEIGAKRDQLGPETHESLQRKLAEDGDALTRKRTEANAAGEKAKAQQAEADNAESAAADAEAEHARKDAEVKNVQAQGKEAEAEAAKEGPDLPPLGPDKEPGGGALDALDRLTKRSHDLAQQVKPGWASGTEDIVRRAAGAFGEKWTKYFDGQSPDEVAEGIKKSRDKVIRLRGELDALTTEYDNLRDRIPKLKRVLDDCVERHTYWTGSPESGPTHPGPTR